MRVNAPAEVTSRLVPLALVTALGLVLVWFAQTLPAVCAAVLSGPAACDPSRRPTAALVLAALMTALCMLAFILGGVMSVRAAHVSRRAIVLLRAIGGATAAVVALSPVIVVLQSGFLIDLSLLLLLLGSAAAVGLGTRIVRN